MSKLRFKDEIFCDFSAIKAERKERFVNDLKLFNDGQLDAAPKLVVTVAATHAGIVTGNFGFYRPDNMKAGLHTFTKDYDKPVLLHHDSNKDPVGRVKKATYRDLSHKYGNELRTFKSRYGGSSFIDAKADTEKAFDQVDWIMSNLVNLDNYAGLGFGELDLHIADPDSAQKILDERYLTVSTSFTTDQVYCSICHQEWASEGLCEHERGQVYDSKTMVAIPGEMEYEEVSWINTPADKHVSVLNISKTPEIISQSQEPQLYEANMGDSICRPILISVNDGQAYRLDSFRELPQDRAQEVIQVAKQKDKVQEKPEPDTSKVEDTKVEDTVEVEDQDISKETTEDKNMKKKRKAKKTEACSKEDAPDEIELEDDEDIPEGYELIEDSVEDSTEDSKDEPKDETFDIKDFDYTEHMVPLITKYVDEWIRPVIDKGFTNNYTFVTPNSTEHTITEEDSKDEQKVNDFISKVTETIVLSEDTLKALKAKDFCGTKRTFPVTDCNHVAAAKELLDKVTGLSDTQKARLTTNINKKEKEFVLTADAFVEPIVVEWGKDAKHAITDAAALKTVLSTLDSDTIKANLDEIKDVCKVFDVEFDDSLLGTSATSPIPLSQAEAEVDKLFVKVDEKIIDKLIDGLMNKIGDELKRKELGEYLVDQLISKGVIEDVFTELAEAQSQLQDAQTKIANLTKSNRDFYSTRQDYLSKTIVALKVALKKPEFAEADEEKLEVLTKELKVRTVDSLQDTFNDLLVEFNSKETDIETEEDSTQVIDDPITPEIGKQLDREIKRPSYRNLSDSSYSLAERIFARYANIDNK